MKEKVYKQTLRLKENERRHLLNESKKCGLKMESFIRKLIMGIEVKPRPPDAYAQLVREINYIGNNINQIAHIANATGTITQEQIEIVKSKQNEIIKLMRGLS